MSIFFQKRNSPNQLDNSTIRTAKNINPTSILYNRLKGFPTINVTTFKNKDIGKKRNHVDILCSCQ